jgi:hypothetical protein
MLSKNTWHILSDKNIVVMTLFMLLSAHVVRAQSYGVCTRTEFLSPVSLYGGTAAGLGIDAQDNLYIAENVNNRGITPQGPLVSKVTPQGTRTIFVQQGILGDVSGLAFDAQGNVYVADGNGNGNEQPEPKNMVWKVCFKGGERCVVGAICRAGCKTQNDSKRDG